MKYPKVCSIVTGKDLNEFLTNLSFVQKISDLVELRTDFIIDMNVNYVDKILKNTFKEVIFTCRHKSKHGKGKFTGSREEQQAIIQRACDLNVKFVDIDMFDWELININKKSSQLILSYHDFVNTPLYKDLITIKKEIQKEKADIIKIVCYAKTQTDIFKLIKLLIEKKEEEKMIVLGMGPKASLSRIVFPLLGCYLTYSSVGKMNSAPGQIDYKDFRAIYSLLDAINDKYKEQWVT